MSMPPRPLLAVVVAAVGAVVLVATAVVLLTEVRLNPPSPPAVDVDKVGFTADTGAAPNEKPEAAEAAVLVAVATVVVTAAVERALEVTAVVEGADVVSPNEKPPVVGAAEEDVAADRGVGCTVAVRVPRLNPEVA